MYLCSLPPINYYVIGPVGWWVCMAEARIKGDWTIWLWALSSSQIAATKLNLYFLYFQRAQSRPVGLCQPEVTSSNLYSWSFFYFSVVESKSKCCNKSESYYYSLSHFVNVPFIASRPRLIVCCLPQICSTFGPRGQFGNLLQPRGSELDTIKPPILENFRRQRCRCWETKLNK